MKRFLVFVTTLLLVAVAHGASIADEVKQAGVVRIGTGNDNPPLNYIDDHGQWVGFDIDLGDALARKLGVHVKRVVVNNSTRIAFLANGQIDMTLSNLSHTRSRDAQIDFAEPPYLWTAKVFYAKKGRFKTIADLGGRKIGVNTGSNAMTAAPEEIAKYTSKKPVLLSFQKNADCFLALREGKIDAFTQDSPIIAAVAGESAGDYEAVGAGYSPGLYSIGVPPNDSKWRDEVSFALQDLIRDGTYEKIYLKWFGPHGKFPLPLNSRPRLPEDAFGHMSYTWPD